MGKPLKDLIGQTFDLWTVLARGPAYDTRNTGARWVCRCECGTERIVAGATLRVGSSTNCGCRMRKRVSAAKFRHGASSRTGATPEYRAWRGLIGRARGYNDPHLYLERGITVCARWECGEAGKTGFECFLADMGERPSAKHSIDREDNDKGYEPGNCRWATQTVQCRNQQRSRIVTYRGESLHFYDAWERSAKVVSRETAESRLKRGWPPELAIDTPLTNDRRRPF